MRNPYDPPSAEIVEQPQVRVDVPPRGVIGWIRAGWMAAAFTFVATSVLLVFAVFTLGMRGFPVLIGVFEAALSGALSYGMYKRDPTAAKVMFGYYVISRTCLALMKFTPFLIVFSLPFAVVFYKAMVATKAYREFRIRQRRLSAGSGGSPRLSDNPLFRDMSSSAEQEQ